MPRVRRRRGKNVKTQNQPLKTLDSSWEDSDEDSSAYTDVSSSGPSDDGKETKKSTGSSTGPVLKGPMNSNTSAVSSAGPALTTSAGNASSTGPLPVAVPAVPDASSAGPSEFKTSKVNHGTQPDRGIETSSDKASAEPGPDTSMGSNPVGLKPAPDSTSEKGTLLTPPPLLKEPQQGVVSTETAGSGPGVMRWPGASYNIKWGEAYSAFHSRYVVEKSTRYYYDKDDKLMVVPPGYPLAPGIRVQAISFDFTRVDTKSDLRKISIVDNVIMLDDDSTGSSIIVPAEIDVFERAERARPDCILVNAPNMDFSSVGAGLQGAVSMNLGSHMKILDAVPLQVRQQQTVFITASTLPNFGGFQYVVHARGVRYDDVPPNCDLRGAMQNVYMNIILALSVLPPLPVFMPLSSTAIYRMPYRPSLYGLLDVLATCSRGHAIKLFALPGNSHVSQVLGLAKNYTPAPLVPVDLRKRESKQDQTGARSKVTVVEQLEQSPAIEDLSPPVLRKCTTDSTQSVSNTITPENVFKILDIGEDDTEEPVRPTNTEVPTPNTVPHGVPPSQVEYFKLFQQEAQRIIDETPRQGDNTLCVETITTKLAEVIASKYAEVGASAGVWCEFVTLAISAITSLYTTCRLCYLDKTPWDLLMSSITSTCSILVSIALRVLNKTADEARTAEMIRTIASSIVSSATTLQAVDPVSTGGKVTQIVTRLLAMTGAMVTASGSGRGEGIINAIQNLGSIEKGIDNAVGIVDEMAFLLVGEHILNDASTKNMLTSLSEKGAELMTWNPVNMSHEMYKQLIEWRKSSVQALKVLGTIPETNDVRTKLVHINGIITKFEEREKREGQYPVPVCLYLWGKPSVGKSYATDIMHQIMANAEGDTPGIYPLDLKANHFPESRGQVYARWDEVGGTTAIGGQQAKWDIALSLMGGCIAHTPASDNAAKEQILRFKAIYMTANVPFSQVQTGLSPESKQAFSDRLEHVEMIYNDDITGRSRENWVRCPNFSNVTFRWAVSDSVLLSKLIQAEPDMLLSRDTLNVRQSDLGVTTIDLTFRQCCQMQLIKYRSNVAKFNESKKAGLPFRLQSGGDANDAEVDRMFEFDEPPGPGILRRALNTSVSVGKAIGDGAITVIRTLGMVTVNQVLNTSEKDATNASRLPRVEFGKVKEEEVKAVIGQPIKSEGQYIEMPPPITVPDGRLPFVTWIYGASGTGKTSWLSRIIEACRAGGMKVHSMKRLVVYEDPLDCPDVLVLDDVVDAESRAGQAAYVNVINSLPSTTKVVVLTNFGPRSWTTAVSTRVVKMWQGMVGGGGLAHLPHKRVSVREPGFARRAGWTGTSGIAIPFTSGGPMMRGEVFGQAELFKIWASYDLTRPMIVHHEKRVGPPFLPTEADIWVEGDVPSTTQGYVQGILTGSVRASSRAKYDIARLIGTIEAFKGAKNRKDQRHVLLYANAILPNLKVWVNTKQNPGVCIHGTEVWTGISASSPTVKILEDGFILESPEIGAEGFKITREQYLAFRHPDIFPPAPLAISTLKLVLTTSPSIVAELDKAFPVSFVERMKIWWKAVKEWIQKAWNDYSGWIKGAGVLAAGVTALIAVVNWMKYKEPEKEKVIIVSSGQTTVSKQSAEDNAEFFKAKEEAIKEAEASRGREFTLEDFTKHGKTKTAVFKKLANSEIPIDTAKQIWDMLDYGYDVEWDPDTKQVYFHDSKVYHQHSPKYVTKQTAHASGAFRVQKRGRVHAKAALTHYTKRAIKKSVPKYGEKKFVPTKQDTVNGKNQEEYDSEEDEDRDFQNAYRFAANHVGVGSGSFVRSKWRVWYKPSDEDEYYLVPPGEVQFQMAGPKPSNVGPTTYTKFAQRLRQNYVVLKANVSSENPGMWVHGTMMTDKYGITVAHAFSTLEGQPMRYVEFLGPNGQVITAGVEVAYVDIGTESAVFRVTKNLDGTGPSLPVYGATHMYTDLIAQKDLINAQQAAHMRPPTKEPDGSICNDIVVGRVALSGSYPHATPTGEFWEMDLGVSDHWSADGSCGTAYAAIIPQDKQPRLMGLHVALGMALRKTYFVPWYVEKWNRIVRLIEKRETVKQKATNLDYVRSPQYDNELTTFESFTPRRWAEVPEDTAAPYLVPPKGASIRLVETRKFLTSRVDSPHEFTRTAFTSEVIPNLKAPVLSLEEIEGQPDCPTDAVGNKRGILHRMKAGFGCKILDPAMCEELREYAVELAERDLMRGARDVYRHLKPISIDEAVSGKSEYQMSAMPRNTSASHAYSTMFGRSCFTKDGFLTKNMEKVELAHDLPRVQEVVKWVQDFYELAQQGKRLSIPGSAKLKNELVATAKVHRKRMFTIVPLHDYIIGRMLMGPIMHALEISLGHDNPYALFADPEMAFEEWYRAFKRVNKKKLIEFDASSFDFTLCFGIIMAFAAYLQRLWREVPAYDRSWDCVIVAFLEEMGVKSYNVGNAVMVSYGGVPSGMYGTHFLDGFGFRLAMYTCARNRLPYEPRWYVNNTSEKHGGDDVLCALSEKACEQYPATEWAEDITNTFGIVVTPCGDKDGTPDYVSYEQATFYSRQFVRVLGRVMPKIKLAAISGILHWQSAADAFDHYEAVKSALDFSVAHGEEVYNEVQRYCVEFAHKLGILHPMQSWHEAAQDKLLRMRGQTARITALKVFDWNTYTATLLNEPALLLEPSSERSVRDHDGRTTKSVMAEIRYHVVRLLARSSAQQMFAVYAADFAMLPDEYFASATYREVRLKGTQAKIRWFQSGQCAELHMLSKTDVAPNSPNGLLIAKVREALNREGIAEDSEVGLRKHFGVEWARYYLALALARRDLSVLSSKATWSEFKSACWPELEVDSCVAGKLDSVGGTPLADLVSELRIAKRQAARKQSAVDGATPLARAMHADTNQPATTSGATGTVDSALAALPPATALTAPIMENPAVAIDAADAVPPVISSQLGGISTLNFAQSGYSSNIVELANSRMQVGSIELGTETPENTVLARYRFNPWSPTISHKWMRNILNQHEHFMGGILLDIDIASAATLIGQIFVVMLPGGHTVTSTYPPDLMQFPSWQIIDLSTANGKYGFEMRANKPGTVVTSLTKEMAESDNWGELLVIAFTPIQNTFGNSTVRVPVKVYAQFTPDTVMCWPKDQSSPGPQTAFPKPGFGTFIAENGKGNFALEGRPTTPTVEIGSASRTVPSGWMPLNCLGFEGRTTWLVDGPDRKVDITHMRFAAGTVPLENMKGLWHFDDNEPIVPGDKSLDVFRKMSGGTFTPSEGAFGGIRMTRALPFFTPSDAEDDADIRRVELTTGRIRYEGLIARETQLWHEALVQENGDTPDQLTRRTGEPEEMPTDLFANSLMRPFDPNPTAPNRSRVTTWYKMPEQAVSIELMCGQEFEYDGVDERTMWFMVVEDGPEQVGVTYRPTMLYSLDSLATGEPRPVSIHTSGILIATSALDDGNTTGTAPWSPARFIPTTSFIPGVALASLVGRTSPLTGEEINYYRLCADWFEENPSVPSVFLTPRDLSTSFKPILINRYGLWTDSAYSTLPNAGTLEYVATLNTVEWPTPPGGTEWLSRVANRGSSIVAEYEINGVRGPGFPLYRLHLANSDPIMKRIRKRLALKKSVIRQSAAAAIGGGLLSGLGAGLGSWASMQQEIRMQKSLFDQQRSLAQMNNTAAMARQKAQIRADRANLTMRIGAGLYQNRNGQQNATAIDTSWQHIDPRPRTMSMNSWGGPDAPLTGVQVVDGMGSVRSTHV